MENERPRATNTDDVARIKSLEQAIAYELKRLLAASRRRGRRALRIAIALLIVWNVLLTARSVGLQQRVARDELAIRASQEIAKAALQLSTDAVHDFKHLKNTPPMHRRGKQ